ncbi:ABC transporter ATP-binding protein [Thalassotalea mangrovi]|uniref:ABC transporter ATP-binding protein n=1 Tax=Thalassotalea mangrovi TaxID=2572245 RepID=A0A4U1BAG4_9GAMM|nr:ABC transporter ATP-binding protein [Thalassotalea mangrovi]TKB47405.1 ABC transporter ATP-binding protein [Thalassotalea mangrovi]
MIEVNKLSKHYRDVIAVDDISFTVVQGHCFGLLGPNGAGKTTTIEIMEGILTPTHGTVEFAGVNAQEVSQHIGIQFQHTALQDYLSVKETLNLFKSFYQRSVDIETLVQWCDLQDIIDRDNRLLSGGQRQRLLLALALINDPQIVFLDEPTTGLDPQSRRHFWQLIENIKEQHKTVILTTHYMDEAQQLCDQIVIMDHGKIIEQGSPKALLERHFDQVFLTLPTQGLDTRILSDLFQPGQWQIIKERVEIATEHVEDTVKSLIQANVPLTGLHVKSANLDDLFLKLTGHSLRG